MTAAVFRNTPSMSVPLTQNTAPVLEFDCLYTHDTRKKAKKWQDGFLRYHTFNKRVMVYDVPRNLIGDMHWAGEEAVQCGDELSLERNGVMVEVAEQIGQTETDLTELRKSKNKPTSSVQSPAPVRAPAETSRAQPAGSMARSNTQLKHKSLNALLGTPRGPIGKAQLPTRSPFEERHANVENEDWTDGRPPKRARLESARTTTTPKPARQSEPPLWARTADAAKQKKSLTVPAGRRRPSTEEIIDLSDDVTPTNDFLPGFSDDALAQSSPGVGGRVMGGPKRSGSGGGGNGWVTTSNTAGRSSSPTFQVQQSKAKAVEDAAKPRLTMPIARQPTHREKPPEVVKPGEPAAKRPAKQQQQRKPDLDLELQEPTTTERSAKPSTSTSQNPASSKIGQTLRLASTSRKKRTLLCQDQLTHKSKTLSSTNTDDAADTLLEQAEAEVQEARPMTSREKVEARLAKINKKKNTAKKPSPQNASRAPEPQDAPVIIDPDSDNDLPDGPSMGAVHEEENSPARRPQTSHQASALELARLDRMMLPPAGPRPKVAAQPPSKAAKVMPIVQPPAKEDRALRRVVSESTVLPPPSKSKRAPGAPVRFTPSPTSRSRESTPASTTGGSRQATPVPDKPYQRPPRSPPDRTAYKKKGPLQKSVSLNMTSNGTTTVMLAKPFQKPGKASAQRKVVEELKELGPWSREAFDLFDWRPPGWDEEKWCMGEVSTATTNSVTTQQQPPPPGLSGGAASPMFGRPVV